MSALNSPAMRIPVTTLWLFLAMRGMTQCPGILPSIAWHNSGNSYTFENLTELYGYVASGEEWNYGDGYYALSEHTFDNAGIDTVKFKQTILGCEFEIKALVAHGGVADICSSALASSFDHQQSMNNEVEFHDTSVGNDLLYFWSFGDGALTLDQDPVHFFTWPGVFDVTHSVVTLDSTLGACSAGSAERILVDGNVSTCDTSLFLSLAAQDYGGSFQFDAYVVALNPDLTITNFWWNYGDGSNDAGLVAYVAHTYVYPGSYQACLQVNAYNGQTQVPCFAGACITLETAAVGLDEPAGPVVLSAYPMPCSDELLLEGDLIRPGVKWSLIDGVGRTLLTGSFSGQGSAFINVSELAPGCCVLIVTDGLIRQALQVVKQ